MASRLLAQILLMGGTYVARAFVQAYQQALVNSARSGAHGRGAAAGGVGALRGRMSVEEAANILGVQKNAGLKQIYERYDRLFHANDGTRGGSVYLQAKIHHAKVEMERAAVERGEQLRTQDGDGGAGGNGGAGGGAAAGGDDSRTRREG